MTWDPIWDEIFRSRGGWNKYPGEDLIRFIARNFYSAPDRSHVKVLDVGCGPGSNLWYLTREGFSVVGIDGSPTAIEQARTRLDAEVPQWKGQLLVGDVERLPIPDGSMDAAIDSECVCCNDWESSKRIYREIARVLRPKGSLFVRTFATGSDLATCTGQQTTRLTQREEIPELLSDFVIMQAELISRTIENCSQTIYEWIIHAMKPG